MKTPEEIAAEMLDIHFRGSRTDIQDFGLTAWMVRAIEADRAQRDATPDDGVTFAVGEAVLLTGASWESWGLRNAYAVISRVTSLGEPEFAYRNRTFAIFKDHRDDFSATRVVP